MNCRLYLRLFLFVLPAFNVLPAMLFCTLALYIFFYFLKGGRSSRSNKVAAAPKGSITPKIFSDMFRVSLADISCYLCLQCADIFRTDPVLGSEEDAQYYERLAEKEQPS